MYALGTNQQTQFAIVFTFWSQHDSFKNNVIFGQ